MGEMMQPSLDQFSFRTSSNLSNSHLSYTCLPICGTRQAIAGTIHNVIYGNLDVDFDDSLLNNRDLLRRVAERNGEITGNTERRDRTYLLSQVIENSLHGATVRATPYFHYDYKASRVNECLCASSRN